MAFVPVIFGLAQPGAQGGFMCHHWWLHLGRISYSVYMVHALLFMGIRALYSSKMLVTSHPVLQLGYILMDITIILIVAHLCYTRIEEPGRRWLLRKTLK